MNLPARDGLIGIGILVGTGLIALAGVWCAWDALARFRAAALLDQAADRRMAGRLPEARRAARDAEGWEDALAARLAAIDPDAPDARERLARIPDGGGAVQVALALLDLRAGRTPSDIPEDGDGAWIRAAIAARARPTPPPTDQPAAMATVATVLPMLASGAAGDAAHLRKVLGASLLLAPRHPERHAMMALCRALDERDTAAARTILVGQIPDGPLRTRAIALWAAVRGVPVVAEPEIPRPPVDGPGPRLALVRDLLTRRDAAAVERVITAAPASERPRLRLAVAEAAGDAKAALPLLEPLLPSLVGMRRSGQFASFDLVLADGSPLRLPVAVVVDGIELPPGKVERAGPR
ncbi:MAG: hypothetical protein RLZZ127_2604, partial [Planctomycetota bacterium]